MIFVLNMPQINLFHLLFFLKYTISAFFLHATVKKFLLKYTLGEKHKT